MGSPLRPELHALKAYHVPDASGLIKLDAMENPFPWPQALHRQWRDSLPADLWHRYPDPQATLLKQQLQAYFQWPKELNLMLGNGSDELIQLLCLAVAQPGACIMAPSPSFSMFAQIARLCGLRFVSVPLCEDDFSLDVAAMQAAMLREQPAIVFLACPNNPTGQLFARQAVQEVVVQAPGWVVIDEAYTAFAPQRYYDALSNQPHVLGLRTLSKIGLAGLRIGMLTGHADVLKVLDAMRLPYNLNALSQHAACHALSHPEVLHEQATALRQQRTRLQAAMQGWPGVKVYPSDANFILFRLSPHQRADSVFQGLLQRGILIKKLHEADPMLAGCLRVTVGSAQENQRFLETMTDLLTD